MSVAKHTASCLFFIVFLITSIRAQDVHPYKSFDLFGLDPVLFLETRHFTNTSDGHTVVPGRDGRWYYARLNKFGNVVPTDMPVGEPGRKSPEELAFLDRAAIRLETEPTISERLEREDAAQKAAIDRARSELTQRGFTMGTRDVLVLGIEFPDYRFPFGKEHVDSLMNINTLDAETGSGGFRDYFVENSYGKFVPESHVHGWFEAEHPVAFYTDTLQPGEAAERLATEALRQANLAGVDFSLFDFDGNRVADPVIIVTPVPSRRIPARFTSLLGSVKFQNIRFDTYSIQDVHLGNLVHEYGHALGLPELYRGSHSLGYYDVMAYSVFGSPPGHFSAFSKIRLGWIDPLVVDEPTKGLLVPNSHDHAFAVRINGKKGTGGCYFLIEYRIQKGYDSGREATISGSGLVIYHIDERDPEWSHVEQADGRGDLEKYQSTNGTKGNAGDAGDFFPGTTNNTRFDRDTVPSSRMDDGADSGVDVLQITERDGTMRFSVELRGLPTGPVPEGRWVEDQIHATSLEDALLSPSTDRTISVYLPAAYDEFPDARFPVLYMLHPWSAWLFAWSPSDFIRELGGSSNLDAAFTADNIRPMIVVFPDSRGEDLLTHYYTNSYIAGNWEDFVAKDVVSHIDQTYRTIPNAAGRGISGLHTGGYGAMMMGMRHPDLFQAVYGLATAELDFEEAFMNQHQIRTAMDLLAANLPSMADYPSLHSFHQLVVAPCLVFAPDSTASPLPCDFPIDRHGRVVDDAWDQWLRHDPYTLLDSTKYKENLLQLNGLGFDCGDNAVYQIGANRHFAQALEDAGILDPNDYREYTGQFLEWLDERVRDYMIPFISDHVEGEIVTSVEDVRPRDRAFPSSFTLHQNYPNPFNATTTVRYDLPEVAPVRLTVFDALGRTVRKIDAGKQGPGVHAVTFDAADLPSGVYFYRLEAGNRVATRSLVLTD